LKKITRFTKNIKMNKILIALSLSTLLFYSCKDEDVINTNELDSLQACRDNLTAENIFNDVGVIVEEAFMANLEYKSCPNYTLINANASGVDTLRINFGYGECPPINGKIRTGVIIVTYTGKYSDSLSVMTTTFDNYHINYNLVQGERIVINNGRNDNGNLCFKIDVNNASITTPLNGTINWQSSRIREWVNGQNTYSDISDDKYKITGNANGNAANGNDFTMKITNPLTIDLGCLPSCIIKSGTAKISPNGYADRIINYGNALCDCDFNININETTYPIVVN